MRLEKNFIISATHGRKEKKIVVQIDKLNSHWSIGQFKELYVLFLYM